jgi:predicted metal-binding protein
LLLGELHRVFASCPASSSEVTVAISGSRCLWSCQRGCNVHLRAPGRAGYVLCDLSPARDIAHALRSFVSMYLASDDGAVPYAQWPRELRGHFLCRVPPVERAIGTDVEGAPSEARP